MVKPQEVVDGIEPGAAVGQADVGDYEPRVLETRRLQRIVARAGDGDAVTEALQHALQFQSYERLVLDDEHLGGDLAADLGTGLAQQRLHAAFGGLEDLRGLLWAETFHADEEERLSSLRGERRQRSRRRVAQQSGHRTALAIAARQRGQKALVEPEPWRKVGEDGRIGRHDLQHPLHGGVTGALRAREQPCKAAQVWYVWCNAFGQ
jgi:hypothetical protein